MSASISETIRILIADDHPVVRGGLAAILATKQEFDVIGESGNDAEAVQLAAQIDPDVILFYLEMPEIDGVQALRQMRAADAELRAIVFTAYDTDERILAAVRAYAQGCLLKGTPHEELVDAIRVVHSGGSSLQPLVASKLLQTVNREQGQIEHETLAQRESEVLQHIARGLQNKEVAAELVISERAVKFHISSLLGKLGVGNRTEAVRIATMGSGRTVRS